MKHTCYFDSKGIIDYYTKLGKTATADYFRGINEKDTDIVKHSGITWIPESFVRKWCDLSSVGPDFADRTFGDLEYDVIRWIPTEGDTQESIEKAYNRIKSRK